MTSKVLQYTIQGWPNSPKYLPEALKPYYNRKDQLTAEQGYILWDFRLVIPEKLRERLLYQIHGEHPGMCKMKALARCYLWWPASHKEIEVRVMWSMHSSKKYSTYCSFAYMAMANKIMAMTSYQCCPEKKSHIPGNHRQSLQMVGHRKKSIYLRV